jgi:flagellar hook-basal body complex protein FliE
MSTIDPSRLLQMRSSILNQNQALQRAAGRGGIGAPDGGLENGISGGVQGPGGTPDFGAAISNALQQVNAQQSKASQLSEAYERGDTHDIVSVMIERQKASLGFETTLQVRNKLLSAYRDIMNMPV